MLKHVVSSVVVFLTWAVFVAPAGADARATPRACVPREQCCKICDRGKACGNSCIRQSYTCHQGAGCACDAENVCD